MNARAAALTREGFPLAMDGWTWMDLRPGCVLSRREWEGPEVEGVCLRGMGQGDMWTWAMPILPQGLAPLFPLGASARFSSASSQCRCEPLGSPTPTAPLPPATHSSASFFRAPACT